MVRRSTPQKKIDDKAFPVRVKILIPPMGLGQSYFEIFGWLDREIGPGEYAHHGGGRTGDRDALSFYFRRPDHAVRFLDAFPWLELADGTQLSTYNSPLIEHRRAVASWKAGKGE